MIDAAGKVSYSKACSRPEVRVRDRGRQREFEAGAFVRFGLHPDASAMAGHDAVRDGEA